MTAATMNPSQPANLAHRAGFIHDLLTVARRSLRGALREPEAVIPALIIPVFFFGVNVGSLQKVAEAAGGFDYKAFQLPVAVIFAVTGVSRANALVGDIASGYFERLLLTPVSRLALLLGLMVADFALVVTLCLPGRPPRIDRRRQVHDRSPWGWRFCPSLGDMGRCVHRLPLLHRAAVGKPWRCGSELHPVLPVRIPHHRLRAQGSAERVACDSRGLEPGDVRARGPPRDRERRLGIRRNRRRDRRHRYRGDDSIELALAALRRRVRIPEPDLRRPKTLLIGRSRSR